MFEHEIFGAHGLRTDVRPRLWDAVTHDQVEVLSEEHASAIAFSANSRDVALGTYGEGNAIFHVALFDPKRFRATEKLTKEEVDTCIDRLASKEAKEAYESVALLANHPELVERFQTLIGPLLVDRKSLPEFIRSLGDERPAFRHSGYLKLRAYGNTILPELEDAERTATDVEIKKAIRLLINEAASFDQRPDQLRMQRAIIVLETMGTPEAIALLRTMGKRGDPAARDTKEARAALERLEAK